jgi:hypothetical protein
MVLLASEQPVLRWELKRIIEIFVAGKKIGFIQYELAALEAGVTYSEPSIRVKVSGQIPAVSPPNFTKFDVAETGGNAAAVAFENYIANKINQMKGSGAQEFSAMLNVPAESVTFKVGSQDGSKPSDSGLGWGTAALIAAGLYFAFRRKKA